MQCHSFNEKESQEFKVDARHANIRIMQVSSNSEERLERTLWCCWSHGSRMEGNDTVRLPQMKMHVDRKMCELMEGW